MTTNSMQEDDGTSTLENGCEEDDGSESPSGGTLEEEADEPAFLRTGSSLKEVEVEADEFVTLEKNCYSLVIVGARNGSMLGGCTAFFFVVLSSCMQWWVIWVLSHSPEYYYGSGGWLLPVSDGATTNVVKTFALVLSLFQVTQEMEEISIMFKVLTHKPCLDNIPVRKLQCGVALLMQYSFALTVCVVSMQLVFSRQRPIDCLWINYYVFMTLNFDNMLCRFLLFIFGAQNWDFVLEGTTTGRQREWNRRCNLFSRVLFLVVPIGLTVATGALAVNRNICPLTWYFYGRVSNEQPVLMMPSTYGLPQGCCPVWANWSEHNSTRGCHTIPVLASVPILSHAAPEMHSFPELYWVVWPARKAPPNSLQIMDGRGGDGTPALLHGRVRTASYQMRVWLQNHDYNPDKVYDHLMQRKAGIKLYVTRFTYVGEWNITHVPWSERTRIFATARNPATGALSPTPVASRLLARELCAPHCRRCGQDGMCTHCEHGFKLSGEICEPCAENCHSCNRAGAGSCDRGSCLKGYGIHKAAAPSKHSRRKELDLCFPCASGTNCSSCDEGPRPEGGLDQEEEKHTVHGLPCKECAGEFGLINDTCLTCEIAHCQTCGASLRDCTKCEPGFTTPLEESAARTCEPCLPNCTKCDEAGPHDCDRLHCQEGFTLNPWHECMSCTPNCLHCDVAGPNGCNKGSCKDGFVRLPLEGGLGICETCSPHCRNCTLGNECDRGSCEPGFGLQGGKQCSKCAEDSCNRCDVSWSECDECAQGHGFSSTHTCRECPLHCEDCTNVERCTRCETGFQLAKGECLPCADQCQSCAQNGEGFCDEGQCEDGWTTVKLDNTSSGPTCRPCHDPACKRCDSHGPDRCDVGPSLTPEPTPTPTPTANLTRSAAA